MNPYQLPADQVAEIMGDPSWRKFTFVRNPYTRTLSCYLHRIVARPKSPSARWYRRMTQQDGTPSFAEFIDTICSQRSVQMERHWRVQADEVLADLVNLDFVGHFERLHADLAELSTVLFGEQRFQDLDVVDRSPMTTRAQDRLAEYYSEELAAKVVDRFARDFELFGYSTDISQALLAPAKNR